MSPKTLSLFPTACAVYFMDYGVYDKSASTDVISAPRSNANDFYSARQSFSRYPFP